MDWQHLIMNGENLAEYAALLAAEGLLGHQHANSGWGTFDDDNMVGATAFMETLELALELRRAGYGDDGERLGFDLYPYTEDAVGAVKRSVLQWRFIDGVAAKIDERRCARRSRRRTRSAPTSSCTPRSALEHGCSSGSTSGRPASRRSRSRRTGEVARDRARRATRSRRRSPAGPSRIPRTGGAPSQAVPRSGCPAGAGRASAGRCTGSSRSTRTTAVLRPAILWNDQRTGGGVRGDRARGSASSG